MALDTSNLPEEDTETRGQSDLSKGTADTEVDEGSGGLEDQFANDKAPGGGSGGMFGGGLSDNQRKFARGAGKLVGKSSKLKKYRGIIGLVVALITVAAPFVLFFLFLFLFKLNHIKELFIDYRFAKFDRVVAERLRAAIDEAKSVPAGEAGAEPAALDAPLETQLAQLKADKLPEPGSAEATKLEADTQSLAKSDLLDEPGAKVDDAYGVKDRAIDEVDPTKTDAEIKATSDENLRKRVDDPKTSEVPKGASELDEAVKETKAEVEKGATPEAASENASKNAVGKFAGPAATVLNAAAKLTIFCIGLDIWGAGRKAYIAYKAGGLVRAAESVYSWADAQKQGEASLSGIGAMAAKFDNGNESFNNSAGAQQASGQPITGPGLSAEARPSKDPPFGNVGKAITLMSNFPGLSATCTKLLEPKVQLAIAAGTVGTILLAIGTGGESLGAEAVVMSLAAGVATVVGSIAGKALIVHEVQTLAHAGISANAGPLEWGNYISAGTKVMADTSCMVAAGCKQLAPNQARALNTVIRNERIARDKQKGLAYQLIATSNPRSVLSQTLFALPSTPSAMIGRIDHFFATIFSPARFAMAGGKLAIDTISPNLAYAEDNGRDPVTGQLEVGVAIGTPRWPIVANSKIVEANIEQFKKDYDKCFVYNSEVYAQRIIDELDSECDKDKSEKAARYDQYHADRTAIHGAMLLVNKKPIPTAKGGSTGGSTAGGSIDLNNVFQPSDNIACAPGTNAIPELQTGYHNDAPIKIRLCSLPNLTSSSSESTPGDPYYINGANGLALVNSRASGAFLALTTAAKAAGLPIAATSTFRTMQHQQDLFNGDSGGAEVAVPGRSNHQMGVAIDFSCNGSLVSRSDQCFAWLSQNAGTYGIKNLPSEAWHWSVDGK